MSLIRNGGFERGDTAFWEMVSNGVLQIETLLPKYGVYCGKIISSGDMFEYVRNTDYIRVGATELLKWSIWDKSTAARGIGLVIWKYDSDYSLIGTYTSMTKAAAGTWKDASFEYLNTPDVAFIQVGVYISLSVAGEVFYIDNMMFNRITMDQAFRERIEMFDESGVRLSGNSSDNPKDMQGFITYYADIDVEIVGGTNPTLDVAIVEIDGNGQSIVIGSFAQAVGVGTERIIISTALGRGMYITYVIGGTNPVFNFEVALTGKR